MGTGCFKTVGQTVSVCVCLGCISIAALIDVRYLGGNVHAVITVTTCYYTEVSFPSLTKA